jgi:prophage regulatory protein
MSADHRSPVSTRSSTLGSVAIVRPDTGSPEAIASARRESRRAAKKAALGVRSGETQASVPQVPAVRVDLSQKQYLNVQQLANRWGVGVSTIWRWANEGKIPSPVAIGPRATRWDIRELDAFEHERKEASR